jgi:hypothetical protein
VAHQDRDVGALAVPLDVAPGQHLGKGIGEVALERLLPPLPFGRPVQALRLGLGPVHDRGPELRGQPEVDVAHPELVREVPGSTCLPLPLAQPSMLLRLENNFP